MLDKEKEAEPSEQGCQTKIEKMLEKQFFDSGIYTYFQENHPELFGILELQILPRLRRMLMCECEIEKKKKEIERLDEDLLKVAAYAKGKEATLRVWERNVGCAYWLNNGFDWFLKAGLTIVPILSLFVIANITLKNAFLTPQNTGVVSVILFISISLIWLTLATIYNLVISGDDKINALKVGEKLIEKEFFIKWQNKEIIRFSMSPISISRETKFFWTMFFIWLSEGLLGWAVIPNLIQLGRNQLKEATQDPNIVVNLNRGEKFEILVGIAIFAFINILFSVAKGRVYKYNSMRKVRYSQALAKWKALKQKRLEILKDIDKLEVKVKDLESKIYPNYEMEYIRTQQRILSNEVNSGHEYKKKNPSKYAKKERNKEQNQNSNANFVQSESENKPSQGNGLNGTNPEISELKLGEKNEPRESER